MDKEAEGENRNHDINNRGGHEITSEFEQTVSGSEEFSVRKSDSVFTGKGVDYREKVDRSVQEQENDKEGAADALDELLSNRGGKEFSHI